MLTNLSKFPTLLFLYLFLFHTTTLLANPVTQFEAANAAYQNNDYTKAIQLYEGILSAGNYSDEIYYNLGNAYFKNKELGKSILNYERALLVAPREEDVLFNLEIANAKKRDDLDIIGRFFLEEWWASLHKLFPSSVWGALNLLSLWAGSGGLILWLFGNSRDRKKQGFLGGLTLISLSILLYFLGNSQANFEQNSRTAIVLAKEIELKNAPDDESSEILEIHEGLKVELLDQIGDWYKVKLSNGDQGWLPIESVEEI